MPSLGSPGSGPCSLALCAQPFLRFPLMDTLPQRGVRSTLKVGRKVLQKSLDRKWCRSSQDTGERKERRVAVDAVTGGQAINSGRSEMQVQGGGSPREGWA